MSEVGVGTVMETGTQEEQVQGVELYVGAWGGGLLCLCRTSPSVCLPLGGSDGALTGDLMDEVALSGVGGQE